MSARLLRKVLREQEVAQSQLPGAHEEEEEEQHDSNSADDSGKRSSARSISKNPFDLLDDNDNENDNENDDGDDQNQGFDSKTDKSLIKSSDDRESSKKNATSCIVPSSNPKPKKKKKNKSKENSPSTVGSIEEPFDELLENLSIRRDSSSHQPGGSHGMKAEQENVDVGLNRMKQYTPSILQVDPRFLSAENELRRIFGSKVVNSFEKNHQAGSSRQTRGGRRGSHNHRKTILVSPSEHWPRWDGSLSMELLESRDGFHYFRYVYSSSYSQTQRAFEAAKEMHDLNGIAGILMHHPYHIDSLITMAEYFKFTGDHQMSADVTAKCIYALESAWHSMFTPLHGNCQLKYVHETNKPMFSTLFAHMKNMDRRGCHRSALEICKLLLSLDSDDPMGAMFCIGYYSLRAEEYRWLERFSEEYKTDNSLWLFPNFSYSLAICRFYLEHEEHSGDAEKETGKATSAELMKQALMLHPSVLKKLVAKVPLKDQVWTKILKNCFFGSDQTRSPSLDHLIDIYIERSYIIWRLPDLQKLLRDSALLVIEMLEHKSNDANDWACVREEAFSSGKNEYRHLLVSDFSDTVPTLPPDNLQNFIVDARMRELQNGDQAGNNAGGARVPRDITNRNALAVLFESMLPWVDYGRIDGVDQHDGHEQVNED